MGVHQAMKWELVRQFNGMSVGFLACTCGWWSELPALFSPSLAEAALRAEWGRHARR